MKNLQKTKLASAVGIMFLSSFINYAHAQTAPCSSTSSGTVSCGGGSVGFWGMGTSVDSVTTGDLFSTNNALKHNLNGNYDYLTIDIKGRLEVSTPQGYGLYLNMDNATENHLTFKSIQIKTNGYQSDAIRTHNIPNIQFDGLVNIEAQGASADGVNISVTTGGKLTFNEDVTINVLGSSSGVGVRVNRNKLNRVNAAIFNKGLTVYTESNADNSLDSTGYGIYAGSRSSETLGTLGGAELTVYGKADVKTTGSGAHAVYANNEGIIQLANVVIETSGNSAHGLATEVGGVTGQNYEGGKIYLTGDTTVSVDKSKGSYAMYSSGKESLITAQDRTGVSQPAIYNVTGDLVTDNQGVIRLLTNGASVFNSDVNVKNANSVIDLNFMGNTQLEGNFLATDSGRVILTMKDDAYVQGNGSVYTQGQLTAVDGGFITANLSGNAILYAAADAGYISSAATPGTVSISVDGNSAKWGMSSNSEVTNLHLINDGEVILGDNAEPDATNRVDLLVRNLSGSGIFYVRSNLMRDGNTTINNGDMIHITDSSSGIFKVYVRDVNLGNVAVSTFGTEVLPIVEDSSGGNATFALGGTAGTGVEQSSVDVGAYSYTMGKENNTSHTGATYWVLYAKKGSEDTNPLPDLNNNAQNTVNLLNANYVMGYIENQTLLQRMGELRQSDGQGGDVWGRAYGGKADHFDGKRLSGFDMNYMGMQIGADRKLEIGKSDADLYLGAMAGTTKVDVNYRVGSGDVDGYHAGFYATYMNPNGFYVDGLIKYVHMKNKINTLTGGGIPVNGSGNTKGFTLGIEIGKRFYLQQPDLGWYIEPQGQLTYSRHGSATIKSSSGLRTELGSYNSTLGRASVIIGYSIIKGDNPVNVYVKTGYVREFSGKTHYTFNYFDRENYDFGGGWWDNGIGVNMQINKKHNLYLDATYAKGGRFDNKQLNVGYRYSF